MFRCFNLFIGKFKRNKIIEESIEKEVDKIIELECNICFDKFDKSIIKALIPCGHRSCCDNCLLNIKINNKKFCCPICKTDIRDTLIIYENLIVQK
tara:strand:- start:251 stop:538 length:288 start_codon:yes stop_codon:yes gene_type:complete